MFTSELGGEGGWVDQIVSRPQWTVVYREQLSKVVRVECTLHVLLAVPEGLTVAVCESHLGSILNASAG